MVVANTCRGYMAPEYIRHGHLSTKVDVFSFGVVVLETVTGLKSSTILRSHSMLETYVSMHDYGYLFV